jgi:hypothetical protein
MRNLIIILFFSVITHCYAALDNKIVLHGISTNQVSEKGYISVKDNFKQVRIYPKSFLEKLTKTKIDKKEPTPIMAEISIEDLNKIHDECNKLFKNDERTKKLCPSKL